MVLDIQFNEFKKTIKEMERIENEDKWSYWKYIWFLHKNFSKSAIILLKHKVGWDIKMAKKTWKKELFGR